MVTPTRLNVDGKVWVGADDEYQVDLKTGQWTAIDYKRDIPKDSPLAKLNFGSYGVPVVSKNNFGGLDHPCARAVALTSCWVCGTSSLLAFLRPHGCGILSIES